MKPKRIQRKRTKGWKMPENTVYVGRPTKYGNPWTVGRQGISVKTSAEAVELFKRHLAGKSHFPELRGKNLACFCRLDQPCHADVLLEIANASPQ